MWIPLDHLVIGSIYLVCSTILLALHMTVIYIFLKWKKDFLRQVSYQIIFCMEVSDMIQLITHFYSAFALLSGNHDHTTINKICGAFLDLGWFGLIFQIFVLAVNRLYVIVFFSWSHKNSRRRLFQVMLLLSWIAAGIFFALCLSPFTSIRFHEDTFNWYYVEGEPWSEVVARADFKATIYMLPPTFLCYIWIVVVLTRQRHRVSNMNKSTQHELRILAQGALEFFYAAIFIIFWHYSAVILPTSWYGPYAEATVNGVLIGFGAATPVLNLIMNRVLRRRFFKLWFHKNYKRDGITALSSSHAGVTTTHHHLMTTRH